MKYGFSREELLWMPISEMFDYIQLINQRIEDENKSNPSPIEKSETPTIRDVFRGMI